MGTEDFFSRRTTQSRLKAEIVSAYFRGWANVMVSEAKRTARHKLGYVDLFSGPGTYEDGSKTTPLLIVEQAIRDPDLSAMLSMRFNDADPANAAALKNAIAGAEGVETLAYEPEITADEITLATAEQFERTRFDPTLFFFDPWGYKGLTLRLVRAALKSWGCDVIFFFNYNRINAGLNNDLFADHMNEIFGPERAAALRPRLDGLSPCERERLVVEELVAALKREGGRYTLTFPFATENGARTSHHLVFVSKGAKGYDIMKGIMAKRSSAHDGGVPAFRFNPLDIRQPSLFQAMDGPVQALADDLVVEFAGRSVTVERLIREHNVGRPYVPANYRSALRILEAASRVTMKPAAPQRRRVRDEVTVPDNVVVMFPVQRS
jgi:three-Cys-motif partner protein